MITFESKGGFDKTERFLQAMRRGDMFKDLQRYGQEGVNALASTTPKRTGLTASAWSYIVEVSPAGAIITWTNSNIVGGTPLVIMLQYGHGTGTGGYVAGRDFINPAIQPIFDRIAADVWKVVTSA